MPKFVRALWVFAVISSSCSVALSGETACAVPFMAEERKSVKVEPVMRALIDPMVVQSFIWQLEPLLTNLRSPGRVSIDAVAGLRGGAHYLFDFDRIEVSQRFVKDRTSEGQDALAITIQHEYGHAVFFANFGRYSNEWQTWFDSRGSKKPAGLFETITSIFSSPHAPIKVLKISMPYQEVFSDLLAVMANRDPRAMQKAIKQITIETGKIIDSRGFDGNTFNAPWMQAEAHVLFAPVRNYLWERYLANGSTQGREAEFVERVFDVMAKEIVARSQDASLQNMPPETMNRRLLNALHSELTSFE